MTTGIEPHPVYLPDHQVDASIDQELRSLLTRCFVQPGDDVFQKRRYYKAPYPHRWIVRDPSSKELLVHAGVHIKTAHSDTACFTLGGVADVCVHPAHRRQGWIRRILGEIHQDLIRRDAAFSLLFGDEEIYRSSGYGPIANLQDPDQKETLLTALIHPLADHPWPSTPVFVDGVPF